MFSIFAISINQSFFNALFSKTNHFQTRNSFFSKLKSLFSLTVSSECKHITPQIHSNFCSNETKRPNLQKFVSRSSAEMSFYTLTGDRGPARDDGGTPVSKDIHTLRRYESLIQKNEYEASKLGTGVTLRIMNYNVLSQSLLEEHHYLYRKQSPKVLGWRYRSKLILAEILAVNPDVLCLQEVEGNHLPTFYRSLENYGYQGVTKMKTGYRPDGLAIFYRVPQIKLIEMETVEYKQPGVHQLVSRDNVGLIVKLEKGGKQFIVANTHLLYNPKRTDVRLAQLQIFLAEIDRITRNSSENIGVLLMGDLNSTPDSPVITLLSNGQLLSTHRPLPPCLGISPKCVHMQKESKLYHSQKMIGAPCEGKEELVQFNLTTDAVNQSYLLSHHFKFSSAYDLTEVEKRGVTTFQHDWVLVDYIFYTNAFDLISRLTLPTASECRLHVQYLPNEVNPSDHLPLVADFLIG